MSRFTFARPSSLISGLQVVGTQPASSGLQIIGRDPGFNLGDWLKNINDAGFPITGPAVPPPASQPAGPPINLQILLASIPRADAGQVITSEYHNSLRNAVLALAQLLGAGVVSSTVAVTIAPAFAKPASSPASNWKVDDTGAAQPAPDNTGKSRAFGWMSVQLPDGARIQSMTVFGKKDKAVSDLTLSLLRYKLADPNQTGTPLISLAAKDGTGPISVADGVKVDPNLGATAALATIDDYQVVDNNTYKYVATANLDGADADANVHIYALQVTCGRA